MEVQAKSLDKANALADAVISGAELNNRVENLAKKAAKNMKIDGFRQGKVPLKVIMDRHAKALEDDARNELLGEVVKESLKILKKELKDLIGEPMINKLDKDGNDIKTQIEISFRPEVKIDEIESIMPKFTAPKVTKKEVDDRINEFLKITAPIEKIEKDKLEKGDYAKFDFEGFVDGVAFEGGKAENYVLEIGSNQFIPGFEDGMIGLKAGEKKDIKVVFPKEYGAPNLAGKEAVFKIKLHEIQAKKPQVLDEQSVKRLMPNDKDASVEKLQENIKTQIKNEKFDKLVNEELKVKFADLAVEKFKFDLPKNVVEQEINMRFRNNWASFSDEDRKKFQENKDELEKQRKSYEEEARKSVALTFIIDELAKMRSVEVSDQEIIQAIYMEAYRSGLDPKQHFEYYKNQNMLPAIKMALVEEKLFNDIFKLPEEKAQNSEESENKPKKTTKSTKKAEE